MRAETAAAITAARIAQRLADSRQGADQITFKQGIDIVTGADIASEDAIRAHLTQAFPDIPVLGEERGGAARAGAPYWLVDPICGTRCYASNVPLYCTNIALVEDGAVTLAAIGVGKTGELLYAERGAGAWLMPAADAAAERITAAEHSNTLWIGGRKQPAANLWRHMVELDRWYLWTFTSSVCYAHFASGRVAGLVHFAYGPQYDEPPVHTAAGCFIAHEAGGTVTDLATGGPWTLESRSFLLGATPALHAELGAIVASLA